LRAEKIRAEKTILGLYESYVVCLNLSRETPLQELLESCGREMNRIANHTTFLSLDEKQGQNFLQKMKGAFYKNLIQSNGYIKEISIIKRSLEVNGNLKEFIKSVRFFSEQRWEFIGAEKRDVLRDFIRRACSNIGYYSAPERDPLGFTSGEESEFIRTHIKSLEKKITCFKELKKETRVHKECEDQLKQTLSDEDRSEIENNRNRALIKIAHWERETRGDVESVCQIRLRLFLEIKAFLFQPTDMVHFLNRLDAILPPDSDDGVAPKTRLELSSSPSPTASSAPSFSSSSPETPVSLSSLSSTPLSTPPAMPSSLPPPLPGSHEQPQTPSLSSPDPDDNVALPTAHLELSSSPSPTASSAPSFSSSSPETPVSLSSPSSTPLSTPPAMPSSLPPPLPRSHEQPQTPSSRSPGSHDHGGDTAPPTRDLGLPPPLLRDGGTSEALLLSPSSPSDPRLSSTPAKKRNFLASIFGAKNPELTSEMSEVERVQDSRRHHFIKDIAPKCATIIALEKKLGATRDKQHIAELRAQKTSLEKKLLGLLEAYVACLDLDHVERCANEMNSIAKHATFLGLTAEQKRIIRETMKGAFYKTLIQAKNYSEATSLITRSLAVNNNLKEFIDWARPFSEAGWELIGVEPDAVLRDFILKALCNESGYYSTSERDPLGFNVGDGNELYKTHIQPLQQKVDNFKKLTRARKVYKEYADKLRQTLSDEDRSDIEKNRDIALINIARWERETRDDVESVCESRLRLFTIIRTFLSRQILRETFFILLDKISKDLLTVSPSVPQAGATAASSSSSSTQTRPISSSVFVGAASSPQAVDRTFEELGYSLPRHDSPTSSSSTTTVAGAPPALPITLPLPVAPFAHSASQTSASVLATQSLGLPDPSAPPVPFSTSASPSKRASSSSSSPLPAAPPPRQMPRVPDFSKLPFPGTQSWTPIPSSASNVFGPPSDDPMPLPILPTPSISLKPPTGQPLAGSQESPVPDSGDKEDVGRQKDHLTLSPSSPSRSRSGSVSKEEGVVDQQDDASVPSSSPSRSRSGSVSKEEGDVDRQDDASVPSSSPSRSRSGSVIKEEGDVDRQDDASVPPPLPDSASPLSPLSAAPPPVPAALPAPQLLASPSPLLASAPPPPVPAALPAPQLLASPSPLLASAPPPPVPAEVPAPQLLASPSPLLASAPPPVPAEVPAEVPAPPLFASPPALPASTPSYNPLSSTPPPPVPSQASSSSSSVPMSMPAKHPPRRLPPPVSEERREEHRAALAALAARITSASPPVLSRVATGISSMSSSSARPIQLPLPERSIKPMQTQIKEFLETIKSGIVGVSPYETLATYALENSPSLEEGIQRSNVLLDSVMEDAAFKKLSAIETSSIINKLREELYYKLIFQEVEKCKAAFNRSEQEIYLKGFKDLESALIDFVTSYDSRRKSAFDLNRAILVLAFCNGSGKYNPENYTECDGSELEQAIQDAGTRLPPVLTSRPQETFLKDVQAFLRMKHSSSRISMLDKQLQTRGAALASARHRTDESSGDLRNRLASFSSERGSTRSAPLGFLAISKIPRIPPKANPRGSRPQAIPQSLRQSARTTPAARSSSRDRSSPSPLGSLSRLDPRDRSRVPSGPRAASTRRSGSGLVIPPSGAGISRR